MNRSLILVFVLTFVLLSCAAPLEWAWMSPRNNETQRNRLSVAETKGVFSPNNDPGYMEMPSGGVTSNGNVWIYGFSK